MVRPLLSLFDLTRAFREKDANDSYSVYFLNPKNDVALRLGLLHNHEIFCLYSPYPQLQARTLGVMDRVANTHRATLDLGVSILLCEDPDTTSEIWEVLLRETERLPIVALSTDQIRRFTNPKDQIFQTFADQHFSRDLFAVESPLTSDSLFYGRDQLVAGLFDRFRQGQNSGIFGLRRIGKTSILHAVERRVQAAHEAGTAYIDLRGCFSMRWWDLLAHMVKEAVKVAKVPSSARRKILAIAEGYNDSNAGIAFRNDIEELLSRLPGKKFLLLLDEIENITFDLSPAAHWEQEDFLPFVSALQSTHQGLHGSFAFVLAGVNPFAVEADRIGKYANPLFSTTRSFFVRPFPPPVLREMVISIGRHMGIAASDESFFEELIRQYGGHPFLTRKACSQLSQYVKERPATFTASLLNEHRQQIEYVLRENAGQILNVLEDWYPNEYELLKDLATGESTQYSEFARETPEIHRTCQGIWSR